MGSYWGCGRVRRAMARGQVRVSLPRLPHRLNRWGRRERGIELGVCPRRWGKGAGARRWDSLGDRGGCDPSRSWIWLRNSGGVVALLLNHRLRADIPPGCEVGRAWHLREFVTVVVDARFESCHLVAHTDRVVGDWGVRMGSNWWYRRVVGEVARGQVRVLLPRRPHRWSCGGWGCGWARIGSIAASVGQGRGAKLESRYLVSHTDQIVGDGGREGSNRWCDRVRRAWRGARSESRYLVSHTDGVVGDGGADGLELVV